FPAPEPPLAMAPPAAPRPAPSSPPIAPGLAIRQARSPPVAHVEAVVATGVAPFVSAVARPTVGATRGAPTAGVRCTGGVASLAVIVSVGTPGRSMYAVVTPVRGEVPV